MSSSLPRGDEEKGSTRSLGGFELPGSDPRQNELLRDDETHRRTGWRKPGIASRPRLATILGNEEADDIRVETDPAGSSGPDPLIVRFQRPDGSIDGQPRIAVLPGFPLILADKNAARIVPDHERFSGSDEFKRGDFTGLYRSTACHPEAT